MIRFIFVKQRKKIDDKSTNDEDNYNEEDMLINTIRNHNAIVVCDVSVKYNAIARVWKITNSKNNKINKGEITSKKWEISAIVAAEGLILLNLIYYIYLKIKGVLVRSIKVYTDNYKIVKRVNKKVFKVIEYITDGSLSVSKIKQLIKKMKV